MPIEVELPDGSIAEFPDGMADADIEAVIQQQFPAPSPAAAPAAPAAPPAPRATDGMSGLDKFRAGIGSGLLNAGEGFLQATIDQASRPAHWTQAAVDQFAPGGVLSDAVRRTNDVWLQPQRDMQAHVDERRRTDADLMSTGAGIGGSLLGTVAPMFAGGAAGLARGAPSSVAAFLPRTIGGNALQGALLGGLQPVASGESRALNAGIGGVAGGAITGALKAPGAIFTRLASLLPAARRAAAESQAGNVIMDYASDPDALLQALTGSAQRELVPGSLPTTAEVAGDMGLADLQKTLVNSKTGRFDTLLSERHAANNAARTTLLRDVFGGADPVYSDAIRSARDQAASRTLAPIEGIPIDIAPVQEGLSELAERFAASKTVREALGDVSKELKRVETVGDAHLVRQTIGHLMSGKLDNRASAKLAANQLGQVRSLMDDQMSAAFPQWGNFLSDYSQASRQASQVDLGAYLLGRANSVRDGVGNPVLNSNFLRTAADLDTAARAASPGFKRASADAMLDQPQKDAVESVRMDLERQLRTLDSGRTRGSDTAKNLAGQKAFSEDAGEAGARALTLLDPTRGLASSLIADLRKKAGDRVAMLVSEAMLDPDRAAEILTRVPPQFRQEAVATVGQVLFQLGPSGLRTLQQSQPAPLEIEITGGRSVPASQLQN